MIYFGVIDMKLKMENTKKNLWQFIRFGIVGLSNTLLGYIIYAISLKLMRLAGVFGNVDIYIAQFIMFILSVAWSFYWNNRFVFVKDDNENRNVLKALVKTYISYAFTSLILAEALLVLWVNVLGINEFIAPVLSLLITVPLNFLIQKFWAFRKEKV